MIQACSSTTKLSLVSDWLKGDTLGERLVMLADDLCHLGLKPIPASTQSASSERWTILSLVLSQHFKNGKHIYSLDFMKCKYCTSVLQNIRRNLRSSRVLNLQHLFLLLFFFNLSQKSCLV